MSYPASRALEIRVHGSTLGGQRDVAPWLGRVLFAALLLLGAAPLAADTVAIHEISYNPAEGQTLEFIELYNYGDAEVDVGGWSLKNGARFEFPAGARIPADGYRLVCRSRLAVAAHYDLPVDALDGDYLDSLSNGGESVDLIDATGLIIDSVTYDDDPPWDFRADGGGPSLQRLCALSDADLPGNWIADPESLATPLAPNSGSACPPPPTPAPSVAISEIHYHELDDMVEDLEFVELTNTTDAPIDLAGYRFTQGITFAFEGETILMPGAAIAVCKDSEAIVEAYDATNVVGNYEGQLSNDGERITLVDVGGRLVDSVKYRDQGDWPVAADGLGRSLEKILATAPSDDPASWGPSQAFDGTSWTTIEVRGRATNDKLLMYLSAEGEVLIDNVSLVLLDAEGTPGPELLPGGDFENGLDPWLARGSHDMSEVAEGIGPDGSAALRVIASGRGSGASQGVSVEAIEDLDRSSELTYVLRFDFQHVRGDDMLTVRLSGSSPSRGIYWRLGGGETVSPGESNGARRDALAPFVDQVSRFPEEPASDSPVVISARVRGEAVSEVRLQYFSGEEEAVEVLLADDGVSGDGAAGDGVWAVELPPAPHSTIVTYTLTARSEAGERSFPQPDDPTGRYAYYVNDERPETRFPVYTILRNQGAGQNTRQLIAQLNCSAYAPASFAYRGDLFWNIGIRRRGQSVCGDSNVIKKYLKVRFNKGNEFGGPEIGGELERSVRKLNFQSLWTDKSLVREKLAWEEFDSVGNPYCFHHYVRLHVNGEYFGLYAEMEHPAETFLSRNGLDPEGNLYKATASREERTGSAGSVRASYEKKTNEEDPSFADLEQFLNDLHTTPRNELVDFFTERVDEDAMIDYQAGQVLTNNRDYPHKNHYLYHDVARGKWMPITWDMDLVYGKRWDGNNRGVLNDLMDNPGTTPWHTTNVRGGGLGNHLLDKFFSQAGDYFRRAYIVRLWDLLHEKHTEERFEVRLGALHADLLEEQAVDIEAWGRSAPSPNDRNAPPGFEANLDRVRNHFRIRRDYLLNYLRTTERFTGHDRVRITEVMYNPAGGTEDAEFLELWNDTGSAIDIAGWTIEGLGRTLLDGSVEPFVLDADTVEGGTMLADGEVLVVVKDPLTFRLRYGDSARIAGPYPGNLANNGETLRVRDAGPGYPATVDRFEYTNDPPWPLRADGLGYSLELVDVVPGLDNDRASQWRQSATLAGSPGHIEGVTGDSVLFSRGDCDANGRLSVADAVEVLAYLFRGRLDVPCTEACDTDGDRSVTLTDAVFLLDFLFRSGASIPAPGPGECGPGRVETCATATCL